MPKDIKKEQEEQRKQETLEKFESDIKILSPYDYMIEDGEMILFYMDEADYADGSIYRFQDSATYMYYPEMLLTLEEYGLVKGE